MGLKSILLHWLFTTICASSSLHGLGSIACYSIIDQATVSFDAPDLFILCL